MIPKKITKIFAVGLFITLGSCSSLRIFTSATQKYKNLVNERTQVTRVYDRGRQVLSAKVLVANRALWDVQEALTPGHAFKLKPDFRQVLLSIGLPTASDFGPQDLKMSLGGRPQEWIQEINSQVALETLYFYSYPFYRVFLIDFPISKTSSNIEKFEILTQRGPVAFELDFGPENLP